jgi:hypothetical protein
MAQHGPLDALVLSVVRVQLDEAEAMRADWLTVRDDQTSGRTQRCVACDRGIGEQHFIICSMAENAYKEQACKELRRG